MMNSLFVGIDVSSKNNVAYLMKPDGSKHSSFSVQNNLGGAKLLSEKIVSALGSIPLDLNRLKTLPAPCAAMPSGCL